MFKFKVTFLQGNELLTITENVGVNGLLFLLIRMFHSFTEVEKSPVNLLGIEIWFSEE